METTRRQDILDCVTSLPAMQEERGRRALLFSAGPDAVLTHTDLSGTVPDELGI
jgi:hypothetical protein